MKKLLFILLLLPALVFGQATGKPIADKPSGGSIGSAATTVDVATLFNLNQTTAGQTLTVPNLTNAAAGKIIYINNTGSTSLTLSPGGLLLVGYGVTLRWTGAAWSVTGIGTTAAVNPTSGKMPVNISGLFEDSHFEQRGRKLIIPSDVSFSGNDTTDFFFGFPYYPVGGTVMTMATNWYNAGLGSTFNLSNQLSSLQNSSTYTSCVGNVSTDSNSVYIRSTVGSDSDTLSISPYKIRLKHSDSVEINTPEVRLPRDIVFISDAGKSFSLNTNLINFESATDFNLTAVGAGYLVGDNLKLTAPNELEFAASSIKYSSRPPSTILCLNSGKILDTVVFGTGVSYDRSTNTLSSAVTDTTSLSNRINLKANTASPTFTGTVTIPSPFTLGATSVTSTGTQLNYLSAATGTTGTTSTNLVFSTSPTLVTPVLGTPTSGDLSNCTGTYFTQIYIPGVLSPADATTYYFSDGLIVPSVTATDQDYNFGYAFTIIGVNIICTNSTTTGSNEDATLQLRNLTQATSSTIGTFKTNATAPLTNILPTTITGLNISVAAGDFIAIQYDAPTYATNPAGLRIEVQLICKKN